MRIRLAGYARLNAPSARGIVLESCQGAIESILTSGTLYDFAARQPNARRFQGRATVYAIELAEGCGNVVVRRSMRGGALSRLGTDLFLPPTRGFRELVTSLRLRSAGVPTPEVIAFAVYRAGPVFRRTDVVTREVEGGRDLATVLGAETAGDARSAALAAAASLVSTLSRAGAHHPDLNLRNILVTRGAAGEPESTRAYVLDVDRIRFHVPGDPIVLRANIERLQRSMRKWRDVHGLAVEESEIVSLADRVMERPS